MTKHTPATPLPWTTDKEVICWPSGEDEIEEVAVCSRLAQCKHDAAYIAHAANAYPKLVEALRGLLHPLHAKHQEADAAELLRELGEL